MTFIAYFGDMSATTLLLVLDLVGIAVFGVSGALAGVDKKLDLFGVLFLSVATGIGGGFMRDALIGSTPAAALSDWRYLVVPLIVGLIVFFAATTPNAASITPTNWSNLVVQNGYILVLAIGMVMVIIAGHIDLSVGSVAAFIGAVAGILVVRPLEQDGWEWLPALPWWAGLLGAVIVGAIVGVWQGFWVAYVGIPAFIVTLAGMLLFRGLALMTLQNSNIGPFPDEFRAIGNGFLDKENALGAADGLHERRELFRFQRREVVRACKLLIERDVLLYNTCAKRDGRNGGGA